MGITMDRRTFLSTIAIGAMMSETVSAQPALDPENTLYMDLKGGLFLF